MVEHGADLGIAHDGDADRFLAIDHEGNEVDGDQIMAILALALKESGKLKDNVLVATVMSNLGLKIALRNAASASEKLRWGTATYWRKCATAGSTLAANSPDT